MIGRLNQRGKICRVIAFLNLFPALAALNLCAQLQRVPNTTLQMPQQLPVFGYATTNALGTTTFTSPIAVATPPGETNRLFVLERAGRVTVVTNLAAPNRTVFMDIFSRVNPVISCEEGLLGIAFHPGYATNRYFFLFYSLSTTTTAGTGRHQRVSRFQTTSTNASVALTNTELPLITQYDEACNHNGGDLHFGPDGYLYISYGDEGNQNDSFNNSQRIDKDFFSGILRIDVDKRSTNPPTSHAALMGATNYFIPADNPFVGATQLNGTDINTAALRAEFWAIGLRNPWRFSFDTDGTLYCGDVGGDVREEVDVISKGGNYGWAYREGNIAGPKSGAISNPLPPINDYTHTGSSPTNQGNCITGGVLYRGNRIAQLTGKYVFCDYGSGYFWSLTPNGTNAVSKQYLNLSDAGIVAFGTDPANSDVLMCDISANQVKRLIYTTNFTGPALPATLAATGAFTNLTTLAPAAGIVPYDLNVPFWSDNAIKTRWVSVPNTNLTVTFNREANWSFPTGTVWIKHFELELTNGAPASRKRLETRFIVKNTNGVYGVTYRWGTSTTNATLVPPEGMDENFVINDGGNLRTQTWHYPSQGECLVCHTPQAGFALGFNTPQLNRDFNYGTGATNQISALSSAGYFNTNVTGIHTLRTMAHATNAAVSLEHRVRSYLAANCSQCHQPGGSAIALWDARITTPTSLAGIINGSLVSSSDTNNRVIVPGSITNSTLLARISIRGATQMPPLASTVVDTQAVALISAWITNDLPNHKTFAQWQTIYFGSTNSPTAAADADPDNDRAKNYLEYLTGTDPTNSLDAWTISASLDSDFADISFLQISNRAFEAQSSGSLTGLWSALDVPANAPHFSITNKPATIPDSINPASNRFYRVRVYEP